MLATTPRQSRSRYLRDFCHTEFARGADYYTVAQRYWEVIFARAVDVAALCGASHADWKMHVDYNPARDGNPIFTARCRVRNLGVRIIQETPREFEPNFDWWIDLSGDLGDPRFLRELSIVIAPGRYTTHKAISLLTTWIRYGEIPTHRLPYAIPS